MMLGIGQYLWRLVPGNPILQRVVASAGKRRRDLLIRCVYLGALVVLVALLLAESGGSFSSMDLAQLKSRSSLIFWWMSHLQLAMVALLAPIFTAAAITQEKDGQTYDILLATPLTNGQILLGSLLSRLFFVIALLVSGIPIFSITQIFGGVAIKSIVQSFAIAAATAFVTSAMAMAIAVFKVGTRRTIFSFYLLVMLYLAIPLVIEAMGYLQVPGAKKGSHINWFSGINPFLALRVIFGGEKYVPPEPGSPEVAGLSWPLQWYLTSPHTFYITFMFTLSFVLITPSMLLLRRLAQSTQSLRSWILQKLRLSTGDKVRSVRRVWSNPIAWREAKTKASAARAVVLRYSFTAAGILGAIVLVWLYSSKLPADRVISATGYDAFKQTLHILDKGEAHSFKIRTTGANRTDITMESSPATADILRPGLVIADIAADGSGGLTKLSLINQERKLSIDTAKRFLLGAVLVELAVVLLIVTQSAASTVTREKEDGTLDLLLSTPITSRYYIWGKLRGLVSFAIPLLAVPMVSLLLFIGRDLIAWMLDGASTEPWVVVPEAILVLPPVVIMVSAFAAILGMHMSLRCKTTVMAVMSSVGIVGAACFGLGACALSALNNHSLGQTSLVASAFSPFTLAAVLIAPMEVAGPIFDDMGPGETGGARFLVLFFGWIVAVIYAAVVYAMYKSMVHNFDMTIRKQAE